MSENWYILYNKKNPKKRHPSVWNEFQIKEEAILMDNFSLASEDCHNQQVVRVWSTRR